MQLLLLQQPGNGAIPFSHMSRALHEQSGSAALPAVAVPPAGVHPPGPSRPTWIYVAQNGCPQGSRRSRHPALCRWPPLLPAAVGWAPLIGALPRAPLLPAAHERSPAPLRRPQAAFICCCRERV